MKPVEVDSAVQEFNFLTVDDVAKILRIGKTKAYKLCNAKGFPAIRMDSIIRIPKDKFEKWIDTYTGREFLM